MSVCPNSYQCPYINPDAVNCREKDAVYLEPAPSDPQIKSSSARDYHTHLDRCERILSELSRRRGTQAQVATPCVVDIKLHCESTGEARDRVLSTG